MHIGRPSRIGWIRRAELMGARVPGSWWPLCRSLERKEADFVLTAGWTLAQVDTGQTEVVKDVSGGIGIG